VMRQVRQIHRAWRTWDLGHVDGSGYELTQGLSIAAVTGQLPVTRSSAATGPTRADGDLAANGADVGTLAEGRRRTHEPEKIGCCSLRSGERTNGRPPKGIGRDPP
jgi:hypothetical protein